MKRVVTFVSALLILVLSLGSMVVSAEEGFISSVKSYSTEVFVIKENTTGDPQKDIVAEHYDKDGNVIADIERGALLVVDFNDEPTPFNEKALERTRDVIDKIQDAKSVASLITKDLKKSLKADGVDANKLDVGIVFDVTYSRPIEEGESIGFKVKNPALRAMKNTEIYTGKTIIFQMNEETEEFEALNPNGEKSFNGGWYELEDDVITIHVDHFCVFMVAAETYESLEEECCAWCRLWHCCDDGCNDCTGFCFCCHWWILLIALVVIIAAVIIVISMKKEKKGAKPEAAAVATAATAETKEDKKE